MINKKLKDITKDDIQTLVDNQVLETKTLEYKLTLPSGTDEDKKEFLADVSSFANSDGGDIVYGIKQTKDKLEGIFGVKIVDIDSEVLRLENLIRDGISPRINSEITSFILDSGEYILIIRVKPNMHSPHRVIYKNWNKFFKRNSAGKYEMDVSELRSAFINGSSLVDKIRDFRRERISEIKTNNAPTLLAETENFIAVHIAPLSSFLASHQLTAKDLLDLKEFRKPFYPLYASGWDLRINLDGFCAYEMNNGLTHSYSQIFRDGKIEGFDSKMIIPRSNYDDGSDKRIPMIAIERKLIEYIEKNIKFLSDFEIQPPYYIFLTLCGVKGYGISMPQGHVSFENDLIQVNDIFLPEVVINSTDEDVATLLKPIFDMVWNASGKSRSYGYDENGKIKNF